MISSMVAYSLPDALSTIGHGWKELVSEAFMEVDAFNRANFPITTNIIRVKEKYGCLRIYLTSYIDSALERKIENIGWRSVRICEMCGEKGILQVINTRWQTRCHNCL